MSIKTVRETNDYSYDIDTLYGTGWFVRKRDDMVSLMDTGMERDIMVSRYKSKMLNDAEFNTVAEQQTYTARWEED